MDIRNARLFLGHLINENSLNSNWGQLNRYMSQAYINPDELCYEGRVAPVKAFSIFWKVVYRIGLYLL